MCHSVVCLKCQKMTWAGCGQHIEQALAGVAQEDRCAGHPKEVRQRSGLRSFFSKK